MITLANIKKAIYCLNKRIDLLEQNGGSGGVSSSEVTELQNKVTALESIISEGENPTAAIDKFNEIVAFLNSIQNTDTLSGLLQDIISLIPDALIQSDWNQTNTSAKDYIKNKPSVIERSEIGVASGIATLDENGHIPSEQIEGYVSAVGEQSFTEAQKARARKNIDAISLTDIAAVDQVIADAFAQQQAEINALRSMLTDISSRINISARLVDSEEYYKVGVPTILYCSGVPNASNIPLNWNSDIMGEWTGVPRFIGQMYIDISSSKLFMSKLLNNSIGDWFQV